MAIRGPRPEAGAPAPLREQPTSPLQRLVDFGMARTPQEAKKLLTEILTLLAGAGFPVPKTGSPEQQLQTALKTFQRDNGLPVTGQLDDKTKAALEERGLMPKGAQSAEDAGVVGRAPSRDADRLEGPPKPGFDFGRPAGGAGREGSSSTSSAPTQKGHTIEHDQAAMRSAQSKPDVEVDLRSMMSALRQAGFSGVGKGKEQLQDAVKRLQRTDGLPVSGRLDANTADALLRRGVIDASTAQALREQDPSYTPHAPTDAPQAETARAPSGTDGKDGAGSAGTTTSTGSGNTEGADGRTDHGDPGGLSEHIGNNYAGDLDEADQRRGHANRDDDDEADDFEHWEVPRLSLQLEAAFDAIVRDDDGSGAATYGWQLVLHRPGIYAAKQPAEELLKLTVTNAGPFDPVWTQALDALNDRLSRYESDADPIERDRISRALQRARYSSTTSSSE